MVHSGNFAVKLSEKSEVGPKLRLCESAKWGKPLFLAVIGPQI